MKNVFQEIFDFHTIKQEIAKLQGKCNDSGEVDMLIICPHYSINIQSKYDDFEQLDGDFNEMETEIDAMMEVNDYDDLCVIVYPYEYND